MADSEEVGHNLYSDQFGGKSSAGKQGQRLRAQSNNDIYQRQLNVVDTSPYPTSQDRIPSQSSKQDQYQFSQDSTELGTHPKKPDTSYGFYNIDKKYKKLLQQMIERSSLYQQLNNQSITVSLGKGRPKQKRQSMGGGHGTQRQEKKNQRLLFNKREPDCHDIYCARPNKQSKQCQVLLTYNRQLPPAFANKKKIIRKQTHNNYSETKPYQPASNLSQTENPSEITENQPDVQYNFLDIKDSTQLTRVQPGKL